MVDRKSESLRGEDEDEAAFRFLQVRRRARTFSRPSSDHPLKSARQVVHLGDGLYEGCQHRGVESRKVFVHVARRNAYTPQGPASNWAAYRRRRLAVALWRS
jgi:hypothetical protein